MSYHEKTWRKLNVYLLLIEKSYSEKATQCRSPLYGILEKERLKRLKDQWFPHVVREEGVNSQSTEDF